MTAHDPSTNLSLLRLLADPGNHDAWLRFVQGYRPIIEVWCRRGLPPGEVEEVIGEVLALLAKKLPTFVYDPAKGRFRAWLQVLVRNLATDHRRGLARRPDAATGRADDFLRLYPDPASINGLSDELYQRFARDLDTAHQIVDGLRRDKKLSDLSWRIYHEHVLVGRPAAEVAAECGVSPRSVYQRSYRVAKLLARAGKDVRSRDLPS